MSAGAGASAGARAAALELPRLATEPVVASTPAEGRAFFVVLGALVGVVLMMLVVTLGTLVVALLAA